MERDFLEWHSAQRLGSGVGLNRPVHHLISAVTLMGQEPEKPHVSSASKVPAISGPLGIRI